MDISEQEILEDKATSHWLKQQIIATRERDICDAINDAEALVEILKNRFNEKVSEGA